MEVVYVTVTKNLIKILVCCGFVVLAAKFTYQTAYGDGSVISYAEQSISEDFGTVNSLSDNALEHMKAGEWNEQISSDLSLKGGSFYISRSCIKRLIYS